jgi:hypothetical protein
MPLMRTHVFNDVECAPSGLSRAMTTERSTHDGAFEILAVRDFCF